MDQLPVESRTYLRGVLAISVVLILVILVATTAYYWLHWA